MANFILLSRSFSRARASCHTPPTASPRPATERTVRATPARSPRSPVRVRRLKLIFPQDLAGLWILLKFAAALRN